MPPPRRPLSRSRLRLGLGDDPPARLGCGPPLASRVSRNNGDKDGVSVDNWERLDNRVVTLRRHQLCGAHLSRHQPNPQINGLHVPE
jgi:hypothetical protein